MYSTQPMKHPYPGLKGTEVSKLCSPRLPFFPRSPFLKFYFYKEDLGNKTNNQQ